MDFCAFIDDRPVRFASSAAVTAGKERCAELSLPNAVEEISGLIGGFERSTDTASLLIRSDDPAVSWEVFCSLYTVMEAAGGVVKNGKDELLMIFRNGKWDLPKGKIESGEAPDEAAIREVGEECGIGLLQIVRAATVSYHTYPYRDIKVLKRTYWYLMHTGDESPLIPQLEEGILQAVWKGSGEVTEALRNSYRSIAWILRECRD